MVLYVGHFIKLFVRAEDIVYKKSKAIVHLEN